MSASKTRLDQALAERGLAPNRTKASAMVMAGQVKVDGKVVDKAGYFVKAEDKIEVADLPRYVSRGAEKLASVVGKFKLNFKDKIMLDVGSSTGGFTDFALQHGAKKVYAVDVGTGQLDLKLRTDERVIVMERTDIRGIKNLPDTVDLVTIDVSFISLKLILPGVASLANKNTQIIAMAKPHFEADKITASKHKGVIKNNTIRREILKGVEVFIKDNFIILDKADSGLAGAKGNVERFYLLKKIS